MTSWFDADEEPVIDANADATTNEGGFTLSHSSRPLSRQGRGGGRH